MSAAASDLVHAVPSFDLSRTVGVEAESPTVVRGFGARYRSRFDENGLCFEPALGAAVAQTRHLTMRPRSVLRGATQVTACGAAPELDGLTVDYAHAPGVVERYEVRAEGVALSWRFDERPRGVGELVVRYAFDADLPTPVPTFDGGLELASPEWGGVTIGGVTGIDANGATIAGAVRHDLAAGTIELTLPAEFVECARYPLVLDPLIGTTSPITSAGSVDRRPDVAYDAATDLFLVVFLRTFSATSVQVYAQRVSSTGGLIGLVQSISTAGVAEHARVANLPQHARFGIVWAQQGGFANSILFSSVGAGGGAAATPQILANSTGVQLYTSPDVAGDAGATIGSGRGCVVVYENNITNTIDTRLLSFDAQNDLVIGAVNQVFVDAGGIGNAYSQPAMSRIAGPDGLLLLAVRRFSSIGPFKRISVVAIDATTGAAIGGVQSFPGTQNGDTTVPDVDGIGGRWMVAWEEITTSGGSPAVQRATVGIDALAGTLVLGAPVGLGGGPFAQATAPRVAWTPGRTWLGYHYLGGIPTATHSLRARAVDSTTAEDAGDVYSVGIGVADTRIVVATMTSGGVPGGELALCVFADADTVYGQGLINHGSNGTFTNLGGGCGAGGVQGFSHAPGIGSAGLVCGIDQLSPTALLSIFNFSGPAATLPCGTCEWVPFFVTQTLPVVAGAAQVQFPIPARSSLIGAQFLVQWTTLDLPSAPCPVLPGLSISDRVQMVVGN